MQIKTKFDQEQLKNKFKKTISVKNQIWVEKKYDVSNEMVLLNKKLNPVLSKLLALRDVDPTNLENYLNPRIKNVIPDPFVLSDMERATEKIIDFITQKKKIGIFGDYDVDGSTSTALLSKYFKQIGVDYEFYIPDRQSEGYGPSIGAFEKMFESGCKLIITLDCGTTAFEEIRFIRNKGVEIIVIDHHKEGEILPDAYAVVNPNKKKDSSNLKNLCAAGVTFFLLISLNRSLREKKFFKSDPPNLINYLDLVALGTICDVVKLDKINRTFVKQGLKIISSSSNLGISSIVTEAGIENEITDYHLGFIIGPRINAGGRVGKSSLGTELLLCNEKNLANVMALKLGEYNNMRKNIEKKVQFQALQKVNDDNKIICVSSLNWHPGVIGIVASKLTEKFNRPSIVISEEEEVCKASCRSVYNFDIGELIVKAVGQGILISGGGHKMAGGFSIYKKNIKKFRDFLVDKFDKGNFHIEKFYGCALNISGIDIKLFDEIAKLSPFGPGNTKPRFLIKDCNLSFVKIVGDNHHSTVITDAFGNKIKGIAFNTVNEDMGNFFQDFSGEIVDIVVTLKDNFWGGERTIQVQIEDIIKS